MKTLLITHKLKAVKTALYAAVLLGAAGCAISGVNTNIFTSGGVNLHPCAIAVGTLTTVGTSLPDGPVAVSTYEGDPNAGLVYVWKSGRAFLSSAPLTNASGKVLNTPTTNPDYIITGITDPEGLTFDNKGNLYIASTSPTPTNIYYANLTDLAAAPADPTSGIPTLAASSLKTIPIPQYLPGDANDSYGQPRGLTFDTDDGNLYATMENYYNNGNDKSTILQITGPASSNPKIYAVGNTLSIGNNCLGLAYCTVHQCFFLTELGQKLHQLVWPKGTTNTTGVNLQEKLPFISLPGVYALDVAVSSDTAKNDSVFFTTANALTTSAGPFSNANPQCYLNYIVYSKWNTYANNPSKPDSATVLDAPLPYPSNWNNPGMFVCWGVGVFPYANSSGAAAFHGIIVADAPKNKVVRFFWR